MKTEFSTPLESWLVVALIAILSAPILGVVVSGCVKKEEAMLSGLARSAGSLGEGSRHGTSEDRFPVPKRMAVKEEALEVEAKEFAGADKTASKSQDEFAAGGGAGDAARGSPAAGTAGSSSATGRARFAAGSGQRCPAASRDAGGCGAY